MHITLRFNNQHIKHMKNIYNILYRSQLLLFLFCTFFLMNHHSELCNNIKVHRKIKISYDSEIKLDIVYNFDGINIS